MQRHGIDASATEDASDAMEDIVKNLGPSGAVSPGEACPSGFPPPLARSLGYSFGHPA